MGFGGGGLGTTDKTNFVYFLKKISDIVQFAGFYTMVENEQVPDILNLLNGGCSLVPYNLPLVSKTYIKHSPEQITKLEETAKADFEWIDNAIVLSVPLFEDNNLPINPIRVTYFPTIESDTLPINRAVAEIGNVFEYWRNFAMQMKTGEFRFFNIKATSLLPVLIDKNGNQFLLSGEKYEGHALFNQTPYKNRIFAINCAGDANFTGSYDPKDSIQFTNIDGLYHKISINDIGLTSKIMERVFNTSRKIWNSHDIESTRYINSTYSLFPAEIRAIIDETALYRSHLTRFSIWRTCVFDKCLTDCDSIDHVLANVEKEIDAEFAKNISRSETIKAVDEFVVVLKEMYDEALLQYKR